MRKAFLRFHRIMFVLSVFLAGFFLGRFAQGDRWGGLLTLGYIVNIFVWYIPLFREVKQDKARTGESLRQSARRGDPYQ